MSSLNELSRLAQRYHLKRNRSNSPSSSSSSSSSTSGYGSILSDEDSKEQEDKIIHDDPRQPENVEQNSTNPKYSGKSSTGQAAKLDINNKGMKLLLKMGWVEGNGLGLTQNGRREPIPTPAQTPLLGLGKATQDAYMLSNAISKPKELESIVIARETEEAKVKREEKVKEIQTRVVEREDRLKTFHCQICDKGYTTITQFEEHERSYAHHHARRAVEAKEARKATGPSTEARLEKERRREAKELERMARAAGMNLDAKSTSVAKPEILKTGTEGLKKPVPGWTKLPSPPSLSSANSGTSGQADIIKPTDGSRPRAPNQYSACLISTPKTDSNVGINKSKPPGFKPSGFAPISFSSSASSSSSSTGFKPIGRTSAHIPGDSNPLSTSLAKLPPAFVSSSSAETGFKSSLNPELGKTEASTSTDQTATPANQPQATSKFAQIAARLAARKAAAAAQGGISASNVNVKSTSNPHYDSEIEKMLNL